VADGREPGGHCCAALLRGARPSQGPGGPVRCGLLGAEGSRGILVPRRLALRGWVPEVQGQPVSSGRPATPRTNPIRCRAQDYQPRPSRLASWHGDTPRRPAHGSPPGQLGTRAVTIGRALAGRQVF
jgi:hypothetical protein